MKKFFGKFGKKAMAILTVAMAVCMMAVPAFASTGTIEDIGITTAMIEPIVDYVVANIAVIMPVGITILGIMIGISLVPRIIKKFTSA